MGELFDEIYQRSLSSGRRNSLLKILDRLDAQDRKDLIKAIKDTDVPAIAIRAALAKRGIPISLSAVYRYRNSENDLELE